MEDRLELGERQWEGSLQPVPQSPGTLPSAVFHSCFPRLLLTEESPSRRGGVCGVKPEEAHMLSALQPQLVKSYLSSVNRLKAQSECLQTLMGRVQLKFNIRYSLGHGHFPNTVLALNLFPEKAC